MLERYRKALDLTLAGYEALQRDDFAAYVETIAAREPLFEQGEIPVDDADQAAAVIRQIQRLDEWCSDKLTLVRLALEAERSDLRRARRTLESYGYLSPDEARFSATG